MNKRDFCFWMQGYIELTNEQFPSEAAWTLILEHLELAIESKTESLAVFEDVVQMFSGFVSIAGPHRPTEDQWERIVNHVSGCFNKVTSELDEKTETTDEIIKEALKKLREEPRPYTPPPPFLPPQPYQPYDPVPNPWFPGDVICSPGTGEKPEWLDRPVTTCSSADDLECSEADQEKIMEALQNAQDTIDKINANSGVDSDSVFCSKVACGNINEYDQRLTGFGGDAYDKGAEIALKP